MNRSDFLSEIIPSKFSEKYTIEESGPNSRKVYDNKPKDVKFLKRVTREKIQLDGAPIHYFPIKPESNDHTNKLDFDNSLKDHTHLELGPPIDMVATWTPQEYQMDLSKFGIIMPEGNDQRIFIHVDEIEEKLGRKPYIGDIIETILDKTRYKIHNVYYGHSNLWENIFCMLTLTKTTYDNYTSQLDKYEDDQVDYQDTYSKLESVLDMTDGTEHHESNAEIQKEKEKTDSKRKPKEPRKKSLDTALDIMTMKL